MHRHARGFTLIELLIVISIIGVLVGILLPALAASHRNAQLISCGSSERQLGIGITAYATEYQGLVPRGPYSADPFLGVPYANYASNKIWITALAAYNAHGTLLNGYIDDKRAMFCPGDDTIDPVQELAHIGTTGPTGSDAYSSYMERQLDETTVGKDKIDDMGYNELGNKARALLLDSNSTITVIANSYRTNHSDKWVNVLYLDGHVKAVANLNDVFTIRNADLAGSITRLHQIMQNADFVENRRREWRAESVS